VSDNPDSVAEGTLSGDQQRSVSGDVKTVMDAIAAFRPTMPRMTLDEIRAARDEGRLQTLRDILAASIARGGEHSSTDVDTYLDAEMSKLAAEGY
jgi:hypothetical protein